jgi:hypothetical protein
MRRWSKFLCGWLTGHSLEHLGNTRVYQCKCWENRELRGEIVPLQRASSPSQPVRAN